MVRVWVRVGVRGWVRVRVRVRVSVVLLTVGHLVNRHSAIVNPAGQLLLTRRVKNS